MSMYANLKSCPGRAYPSGFQCLVICQGSLWDTGWEEGPSSQELLSKAILDKAPVITQGLGGLLVGLSQSHSLGSMQKSHPAKPREVGRCCSQVWKQWPQKTKFSLTGTQRFHSCFLATRGRLMEGPVLNLTKEGPWPHLKDFSGSESKVVSALISVNPIKTFLLPLSALCTPLTA